MKKFAIFVAMCLVGAIAVPNAASADELNQNYSSLTISNGETPEVQTVTSDGISVIDKISSSGTSQESVVENRLNEFAVLDESLLSSTSDFSIASVASATSVEFVWTNPHDLEFSIVKDGTSIAVSDGSFFVDEDVIAGEQSLYEFVSLDSATSSETTPLDVSAQILVTAPAAATFSAALLTTTLAATLPTYSYIRYQAFIQQALVAVPPAGCEYLNPLGTNYFDGDNHLWDPTSTHNRVAITASINWSTLALTSGCNSPNTCIAKPLPHKIW